MVRSKTARGVIAGVCLVISGAAVPVSAAPAVDPQGTVITATIRPVRHIVINRHQIITQIFSNTPKPIAPAVFIVSDSGQPVAITPFIREQYERILAHADTSKTGEIYENPSVDQFSLLYVKQY